MAMQSMQGLSVEWADTRVIHQVPRNLVSEITSKVVTQAKVVSLVAPAGYGKTNLVLQCQQAFQDQNIDCRYIKLEPKHNKRTGFTSLMQSQSCSLQMRNQRRDKTASRESFNSFRNLLVNSLSRRENNLVIVLDGMENIRSREITDFIHSLITLSSCHVRFVLTSRVALSIPLSELRMQGRLFEPAIDDIALSVKEIQSLAQQILGEILSNTLSAALENKTRGWAAGVVVALQAMAEGSDKERSLSEFSGRDRALVSYFREKLFTELDDNTKQLLIGTATEDRVTEEFIRTQLVVDGASEFMEAVENLGLFISDMTRDRSAFSYHPLFRDYLRYELTKTFGGMSPLKSESTEQTPSSETDNNQVIYADFDRVSKSRKKTVGLTKCESLMVEPLTTRELQLLELISCGDTNREVAEKLFISEQTVKWHLNKVYAKMGVKNRTTAVAKARSCHVI